MEGDQNLDEELNAAVILTDQQLNLLDSLPICDEVNPVVIAHMVGFYTKAVHARFTSVNFTRLDASGVAMSTLTLFYIPAEKKCRFISGDINQMDQFLAVAAFVN